MNKDMKGNPQPTNLSWSYIFVPKICIHNLLTQIFTTNEQHANLDARTWHSSRNTCESPFFLFHRKFCTADALSVSECLFTSCPCPWLPPSCAGQSSWQRLCPWGELAVGSWSETHTRDNWNSCTTQLGPSLANTFFLLLSHPLKHVFCLENETVHFRHKHY